MLACPPPVAAVAEGKRRGYLGAGFCPGGTIHIIKKIVATAGDRVAITGQGVTVNGELMPDSTPTPSRPVRPPHAFRDCRVHPRRVASLVNVQLQPLIVWRAVLRAGGRFQHCRRVASAINSR